ncbi:MAG: hypothetical protein AB7H97_20200 [Pseudobdellovibrionaceae bacterium]
MNSIIKLALLFGLACGLSACGKSGIVSRLDVETSTDSNSDVHMKVDADFNLGKLRFPNLSFPIPNIKNPGENYGNLQIGYTLDGKNRLQLDVNISQIESGNLITDHKLPNGSSIPVSNAMAVFSIPILGSSKVYFGFTKDSVILGVALAIQQLDAIGQYLPGTQVFLPVKLKTGGEALAGVFTGSGSGQNGLALFLNAKVDNLGRTVPMGVQATGSSEVLIMDSNKGDTDALEKKLAELQKKQQTLKVK